MTAKVRVDAPICSHDIVIEAKDNGDGTVAIRIESDCRDVSRYGQLLTSADINDLTDWRSSNVLAKAAEAGLTLTCLAPTAVLNCCWVEMGMISRHLALEKKALCIHFLE
jgi:hypothetical protein